MTLHIKQLFSIGAVDNGDNPEAGIVFWKRKKMPKIETPEDMKAAEQMLAERPDDDELRRHIEQAREQMKPMMKGGEVEGFDLSALSDETRDSLVAHIEVLKAERDAALEAVPAPEPVVKALPDDVAELIAKAKAEVDTAKAALAVEVEKRATVELASKFEKDGLTGLLGSSDEVAPNLRALEAAAPEAFAAVYGNLVAAAQRVDLAKALGELGENTGEAPDPYTQRDQWVAKMLAASPDADVKKLRSDFWALHPDAFAETRNK